MVKGRISSPWFVVKDKPPRATLPRSSPAGRHTPLTWPESLRKMEDEETPRMSAVTAADFLRISPRIRVLPIVHGSGDFAIRVRAELLEQPCDCLAVPLPP